MRLRFSPLRARIAASLSLAAIGVACGAPGASDDAAQGDERALTRAVRKGDEFVRCWTVSDGNADAFFRVYELKCRVSSAGLAGLPGSSVYVDARSVNQNVVSGAPGRTPDEDVLIGRVRKSDFPLSLSVYGTWGSGQSTLSYYRVTVPAAEGAGASAPVVVKVPFDMWPVTFLNKSSIAVVDTQSYEVQVAPFLTEQDIRSTKTTFSARASTGVVRGPQASLDLVAPKIGGIDLRIQTGRGSFNAKIEAPGVYVIEDAALRLATAEEEAAAGPAPSPEGGADTGVDAGPRAPATDAGPPPAPAPTCGDPGQKYCKNASGAWYCNAGTRLDQSTDKCVACGNDGQTYCVIDERNISGSWKCNAGTRLDQSTDKCVVCGALGQTHCVADARNISGNWVCDPGLRVDSSSGNCVN